MMIALGIAGIIILLVILWLLYDYENYVRGQLEATASEYEVRDLDIPSPEFEPELIQDTITIDKRGYQRDWDGQLVHRKVAYKYLYSYLEYPLRFGSYDVHHIDGNKLNNNPNNLQILTREEHEAKHRLKASEKGKKK